MFLHTVDAFRRLVCLFLKLIRWEMLALDMMIPNKLISLYFRLANLVTLRFFNNEWLLCTPSITEINLHVVRSWMSSVDAPWSPRVIQPPHVGLQVPAWVCRRCCDLIIPNAESIGHAQLVYANWTKITFLNHKHENLPEDKEDI